MAEIIRMPRLSDTMEEGNIVSWLKKVGDTVKPGDILAEVETDKATMELESYFTGTLIYIGKESGTVPVDGIIAIIGDKSDDVQALLSAASGSAAPASAKAEPAKAEQVATEPAPIAAPVSQVATVVEAPAPKADVSDQRVKASPLAKSLAAQAGLDISLIPSSEHGRIIKRDVEAFMANPVSASNPSTQAVPVSMPVASSSIAYGDHPVSQMRKVIAKRLGESKFSAPHFYLTMEIDMEAAIAARTAINEANSVRISYNDMVIKACAVALRKHPMINSSWYGDKITVNEQINIGVAVAVNDGLLVPVIHQAEYKTLSMINSEVKTLAAKAKDKKLTPAEMQGNTFTISNLGMFEIEEFTAIINPPDACILAVGAIVQKPVVKNGQIVVGNTMKVTLSCDHRVVDGATGAQFLQTLRDLLQAPVRMLA